MRINKADIEDRTGGEVSSLYIVTGSIGPHFEPQTFASVTEAWKHAAKICKYGKENNVWPKFKPCIEGRNP